MHPSDELSALLRRTFEALDGVPDEALGTVGRTRFSRKPTLAPAGRAWRLGVLLLARDARLYATGDVTRAIEPLRGVTNRSAWAEERREDRRAAVRGHFPLGEVVNFGYSPIDLERAPGPLSVESGVLMVRWGTGPETRPLADYLADRIDLLKKAQ